MRKYRIFAVAAAIMLAPLAIMAQNDSSQGGLAGAQGATLSTKSGGRNATVHGKANNALGQPIADANVFATTDASPASAVATFVTDANGEYKGTVPEGKYVFVLQEKNPKDPKKEIDDSGQISVAEKQDLTVNFDGTREEFIKKLSPEARKALEETKAKNAAIMAENAKIKNLNAILLQERDARKSGNLDQATQLATQITQGKPDEAIGWYELGKDQVVAKKYDDAIGNLQKALQLNQAAKKPDPAIEGAANAALGDAYAATKKMDQAVAAYDTAGKVDPQGAAIYYTNETIVLTAAGESDKAATAADKAIAADPTKPLPYYLKGQALVQKATTDASNKIVVPPGCVEAYQKYLELDPNGSHAEEVQQVLEGIGAKVQNKYKAKK
jgi:Flp pilus assembly protein TadD